MGPNCIWSLCTGLRKDDDLCTIVANCSVTEAFCCVWVTCTHLLVRSLRVSHRHRPKSRLMSATPKVPIFPVGWSGSQSSSKGPEGNVARRWKNGGNGTGKTGNFCPLFSHFSPIFLLSPIDFTHFCFTSISHIFVSLLFHTFLFHFYFTHFCFTSISHIFVSLLFHTFLFHFYFTHFCFTSISHIFIHIHILYISQNAFLAFLTFPHFPPSPPPPHPIFHSPHFPSPLRLVG